MFNNPKNTTILVISTSFLAYLVLMYYTPRTNFYQVLNCFLILFLSFALWYQQIQTKRQLLTALAAAIFFRLILLLALPNLTDDFYRFNWDGRLLINGISSFEHLPSYFIAGEEHFAYEGAAIKGINKDLYQQLNSPNYYTIYPPVCQAVFYVSCWFFPSNVWAATCLMKCFIFLFELGSILLLYQLLWYFKLPEKRVLLYALNPLVIVELCGNLHFEGAMIFFLLLAFWFLRKLDMTSQTVPPPFFNKQDIGWPTKNLVLSATAMAMAVCSKLLPLMFLPILAKKLGFWRWLVYCALVGIITVICFMPLLNFSIIQNLMASVGLYFESFEFNASFYYLVKGMGYCINGHYPAGVGKWLGLLTVGYIFYRSWQYKNQTTLEVIHSIFWAFLGYWLLASTVHPWYLTGLLMLSVFTNYRFVVLWSALAVLSYYTYLTDAYLQSPFLAVLEYVLVLGCFYGEYRINCKLKPHKPHPKKYTN